MRQDDLASEDEGYGSVMVSISFLVYVLHAVGTLGVYVLHVQEYLF